MNFCAADYVRLLLEHDADVNATNEHGNQATALMFLMQTSRFVTDEWRLECLDLLAGSQKLEIDRKDAAGYTPFVAAVEWGRSAEVLHALLAHGADVNAQTIYPGFTALAAASAGATVVDASIVKLLLEAKADATIQFTSPSFPHSTCKRTPRAWAAEQGRLGLGLGLGLGIRDSTNPNPNPNLCAACLTSWRAI